MSGDNAEPDAPRPAGGDAAPRPDPDEPAACDICGSPDTEWVRCKLVCRNCRTILMSCGDL